MAGYIARRLAWTALLLLAVSAITFLIFSVLPSADPVALRAGKNPSPEVVASLTQTYGLDRPWYEQYGRWLERVVLHQDLGFSYANQVGVGEQVMDRLPATLGLALGGVVVWLLVGIPLGVLSAMRRRGPVDRGVMGVALLLISAPVYWLGLVALYLFADDIGKVPLLPGAGSYPTSGNLFTDPVGVAPTLLLPWLVLAASFAAIYARLVRGNLVEVMHEDYIRTARAKGLPERTVVWRHGVRMAITPVVTMLGIDLGILLGGAILVESVFNVPGIGRLAVDAIQGGDLPTVQGTVLIGAAFIIVLNLLVDLAYAVLDPRVRYR